MAKREIFLLWTLTFSSAIMLSIPFLVPHMGLLMLFSLIPLLYLERICTINKTKKVWVYYYSTFFIWNLITTYWVYNATLGGAIGAVILNSLQMALVFALFRWFKKRTKPSLAYMFLILGWLAWEHFYFEAEISWPWLTLGNAFASSVKSIQWYEFTGTLGGSFWILLSNIFIFNILVETEFFSKKRKNLKSLDRGVKIQVALAVMLILIPISISHYIFYNYKEISNPKEFLVLQPNIDPYNDKFGGMTQKEQDEKLLSIASKGITPKTSIVVTPETVIDSFFENSPNSNDSFNSFTDFMRYHPKANMLFGAVTYYIYPGDNKPNFTARSSEYGWIDRFNSAVFIDSSGNADFYHKSKLVVLVEFLPYPQYFPFIADLSIDLGGSPGSCGTQKERSIFTSNDGSVKIGAAICYESIYGDFYREYVLKGANVMSIITNDGWWGNTPGYKQHLTYASLRAIETRRSIARSANTGISALINQRGEIVQKTDWWKDAYLRGDLNLNDKITTFVKYGDFIGRIAYYSMFLFFGLAILLMLKIYGKGSR